MIARSLAVLCGLVALGCGSPKAPTRDDAGKRSDGPPSDAAPSKGTDVSGTLNGTTFHLTYAAFQRETPNDPRNWVCAADIPLTFAQCQQTGSPARTMFLGPFVYDSGGVPQWVTAQTGLFRVGTNASSALAYSGTLQVATDNQTTGALQLTFNVDFGEKPTTMGSISVGQ